jgi:hypothetical protein
MPKMPIVLCLTTVLAAGCTARATDTIPPEPGAEPRPPAEPDTTARNAAPGMGVPENRAAARDAGGPDASSPGGPHPQPASTAGGTGDTRGLVRSGSPN